MYRVFSIFHYFLAMFRLKMFVKFKLIFFYITVPEFSFDCYNSNIIIGCNCLFIKFSMHFDIINFLLLNQPFSFLETVFISWLIGSDYDQGFILAYFSRKLVFQLENVLLSKFHHLHLL